MADPAAPPSPGPPGPSGLPGPSGPPGLSRPRGLAGTIWVLEHAQDYVASVVGVGLILLAAVLLVSGFVGFVVLSLRTHRLVAQPFIVVGLVAVIRKILLMLSDQAIVSPMQFWPLIAMVAAFVAGLIAVSRFERREE
jgi:hypothetical protein